MSDAFKVVPVGFVRKKGSTTQIEVQKAFESALLGLASFSHIYVLYWFHENDTPEKRDTLQVHPRGNPQNPLTGVFATHSPVRPNLVALSICRIVAVRENVIEVEGIDAHDGTPVIDIKSYNHKNEPRPPFHMPAWARTGNTLC